MLPQPQLIDFHSYANTKSKYLFLKGSHYIASKNKKWTLESNALTGKGPVNQVSKRKKRTSYFGN